MDYENIKLENPEFSDDCVETVNAPATPNTGNILGMVSMILGFTALGTQLLGIGTGLSLPSAVASLICGFITKYYSADGAVNGQGKIGIICSLAQIGLTVLSIISSYVFLALFFIVYFGIIFLTMGSAVGGMAMYGM